MQTAATYDRKIVHIGKDQVLRDIVFQNCFLVADLQSTIELALNVRCTNCTFIYDGMEVSDAEWMALMANRPPIH